MTAKLDHFLMAEPEIQVTQKIASQEHCPKQKHQEKGECMSEQLNQTPAAPAKSSIVGTIAAWLFVIVLAKIPEVMMESTCNDYEGPPGK